MKNKFRRSILTLIGLFVGVLILSYLIFTWNQVQL